MAGLFVGVVAYADDLVLLAPNRGAAQHMLSTCEAFAAANNIRFSTDDCPEKSKSKALYMTGHSGLCEKPVPLTLCGKLLPWVEKYSHLGHTLNVTGSMDMDCKTTRAEFISGAVKVREQFNFAHPCEILFATEKYCNSFYGSNLYDLRNEAAFSLASSWRTNVKLVWNVPRNCRTYFVDNYFAAGQTPPIVSLMTCFRKFFRSLIDNSSIEVMVLSRLSARDVRTNLGSNLRAIQEETELDPWLFGGDRLRDELLRHHTTPVPQSDTWRLPLLEKLLTQRTFAFFNNPEDIPELDQLINSLVST